MRSALETGVRPLLVAKHVARRQPDDEDGLQDDLEPFDVPRHLAGVENRRQEHDGQEGRPGALDGVERQHRSHERHGPGQHPSRKARLDVERGVGTDGGDGQRRGEGGGGRHGAGEHTDARPGEGALAGQNARCRLQPGRARPVQPLCLVQVRSISLSAVIGG